MMGKKITSQRFDPKVDLGPDDLESLCVQGLGKASESTLRQFGWTGGCAGTIGFHLAADNARILSTQFNLLGALHEDDQGFSAFKASKYWPKVPTGWELRIPFKDLGMFRFDEALQSAWVGSQAFPFEIFDTSENITVPFDKFEKEGGSHFSLRTNVNMHNYIWLTVNITIVPMAKYVLFEQYECATDPIFPGLKLLAFDAAMLPNATKPYGLAFFPLLVKGDKDVPFPQMASFAFRDAASKLLQKGALPKLAADITKLMAKLKKIKEKGAEALAPVTTAVPKWPDALPSPSPEPRHESTEGRTYCF